MKNKNLLSLLENVTNQQESGDTAEFENLGQELAIKLKGGAAGPDDEELSTFNGVCTQNTGCGKSAE